MYGYNYIDEIINLIGEIIVLLAKIIDLSYISYYLSIKLNKI